jgi:hypothetical protein
VAAAAAEMLHSSDLLEPGKGQEMPSPYLPPDPVRENELTIAIK